MSYSQNSSEADIKRTSPPDLTNLKAYRRRIYSTDNSIRNAVLRKLQTWNSGLPKVELLKHLALLVLRHFSTLTYKVKATLLPTSSKEAPAVRPVLIAKVDGGAGDLIIAARFLIALCKHCDIVVAIEYDKPELAAFVFRYSPCYIGMTQDISIANDAGCVARIRVNHTVLVDFLAPNAPDTLRVCMEKAVCFNQRYMEYISKSPFLDGLLGDALGVDGLKRHKTCHTQFGLTYENETFLRPPLVSIMEELRSRNLDYKSYITISDGWDSAFGLLNGRRPTKALPASTVSALVTELKALRPDLKIIQIGGGDSGQEITAVDHNFRGKTGWKQSILLLAGARLHVDTEGGLVHLAAAVGTPASVFFGPTNHQYFSYATNQTLLPSMVCTNCWWVTNTWMSVCPLHRPIICMQSYIASDAAQQIASFLIDLESPS